jgi:putative Holliday junction resolvase
MGLDFGSVRVGVALSDELRMIASPLEFIPATPFDKFMERLQALVSEKQVDLIVVGMPRNMDGSFGPAAQAVREFIDKLKTRIALPIRTWDERLTSAQANRLLIEGNVRRENRKRVVDKMAAAILLQSFLDSGLAGEGG